MYERFTDRARKTMQLANQEAQRYNHEYIGTEHILLGLAKEASGVAANVLKNLDVDPRVIVREVGKLLLSGPDMGVTMGKLPQTPRAKKVVEFSMDEARNLRHHYVGTEHILLGLLRELEGVAAQVLINLGLQLEAVREETLSLLGEGDRGQSLRELAAEADLPSTAELVYEHTRVVFAVTPVKIDWLSWLRSRRIGISLLGLTRYLSFSAGSTAASNEPTGPPKESDQVTAVWREANTFAKAQRREYLAPADLLYGVAVWATDPLRVVLREYNIKTGPVRAAVELAVGLGTAEFTMTTLPKTPNARAIRKAMCDRAAAAGSAEVTLLHLVEALLEEHDDDLYRVMIQIGSLPEHLAAEIHQRVRLAQPA